MNKYLRLQASVFGDFKDIDLSQESMSKLYQIYLKENMMPSVMKEFDVLSQNIKNRPNFIATDNSISIAIASNRIDIISDLSAGEKILTKAAFVDKAVKYLTDFFEIFSVNVSRMSFIIEGISKIVEDLSDNDLVEKYINTDCVYNKDKIFEWAANSVTLEQWKINDKIENVNLNVTVALRKLNGMQNGQSLTVNGLVVTQDLNTQAENTALRLGIEDVKEFLHIAKDKSDIINSGIEG